MGNASIIPTIEQRGDDDTAPVSTSPADKQKLHAPELAVASVKTPNPAVSAYAALAGYGDTGHSPSDAT